MLASVQFQARQVRSGVLLLALLDDEELGRLARDASRELAKIKVELLQANLMKLVAGSAEDEGPAAAEPRRRRGGRAGGPPGVTPDAGARPVHDQPDRAGQARARSTRSSAATPRSARWSTS